MYIIKEDSTCCLKEDKKFSNSCKNHVLYVYYSITLSQCAAVYTLGIHICMYLI